jgi:hypothetical protein
LKRFITGALLAIVLLPGCGSRSSEQGVLLGDDEVTSFARASQLYFRGSLSLARDEFASFIDRYPGSPVAAEAVLALRRIDQDLGETVPVDSAAPVPLSGIPVAVVGLPGNAQRVNRVLSALLARGYLATSALDEGAPDMTLVLFPEGFDQEAAQLADTLGAWLTSPASIPVQPGGQIAATIVPGHSGLLVVVGADASMGAGAPISPTGGGGME